MKKTFLFIVLVAFPILASAQASGGQIRRSNKISSPSRNKENRINYPQIKVLNESEKTCELYFDVDKQKTCISRSKKGKYVIPAKVKGYTVVRIGDFAFSNCEISEVEIPNTITSIGKNAFGWCSNLKTIEIPNSVKKIGEYAFERCESLYSISIPNSEIEIGRSAFRFCYNLVSVQLSDNLKTIETGTFEDCKNLTTINLPSATTFIGSHAFSGCAKLQSIIIPSKVKSIGPFSFSGCTSLSKVNISNGVFEIGENAFKYTGITSITLPNSVYSIGTNAFQDCQKLTKVISQIITPFPLASIGFNKTRNITLVVPIGTTKQYKYCGWDNYFSTILEQ